MLVPSFRPAIVSLALSVAFLGGCAQKPVALKTVKNDAGQQYTVYAVDDWSHPEQESEMEVADSVMPLTSLVPADLVNAQFRGHDRKIAKTSISDADTEDFQSLSAFTRSLPSDDDMRNHDPALEEDASFDRVEEENRNVKVAAYVCAIKFETDSDWHIIVAGDKRCNGPTFFNVEVSGLPKRNAADYATLLQARKDLATLLADDLPGSGTYRRYDPPLHVQIEGSIFYDIDHAPGVVGPTGMRPSTAWEIHPVTSIVAIE
ncbi:hypothetical protein [Dongia sp.]|jgi:hypothetical protein|uniref:hypothetical protein n=1 Tax=Dongia sp. TaxID=1977262 RepID=UPI0035B384A7